MERRRQDVDLPESDRDDSLLGLRLSLALSKGEPSGRSGTLQINISVGWEELFEGQAPDRLLSCVFLDSRSCQLT